MSNKNNNLSLPIFDNNSNKVVVKSLVHLFVIWFVNDVVYYKNVFPFYQMHLIATINVE